MPSSISEASLLRFTWKLPDEFDDCPASSLLLTPSFFKGFELELAEGVMLILGREDSTNVGWGLGVDVCEGFDDSGSTALSSSDFEEAGVDVPSLARRLARIWSFEN